MCAPLSHKFSAKRIALMVNVMVSTRVRNPNIIARCRRACFVCAIPESVGHRLALGGYP